MTIEKDMDRKNELTAKVNGIDIPLISSIIITSIPGKSTKVTIECVVGIMNNGDGVLIKESELMKD